MRAKEQAMTTAHFPPFDDVDDVDDDTVHGRRRAALEDQPAQDESEDEET